MPQKNIEQLHLCEFIPQENPELKKFCLLIKSFISGGAEGPRLSKKRVSSCLERLSLIGTSRSFIRDVAINALAKARLTTGARESLQQFLDKEQPCTCPPTLLSWIRLLFSDGFINTSVEQQAPEKEEHFGLISLVLASAPVADTILGIREIVEPGISLFEDVSEEPINSTNRDFYPGPGIDWPESGKPLSFSSLLPVIRAAFVQLLPSQKADSFQTVSYEQLEWLGPNDSVSFGEKRTVMAQLADVYEFSGNPLDGLIQVALQLGMEQGRRAAISGSAAGSIDLLLQEGKKLLVEGQCDYASELLSQALPFLARLDFDAIFQPLVEDTEGRRWPEGGSPTSMKVLVKSLRKLFLSFYQFEPRCSQGIVWLGPTTLPGMMSLPIPERLSARALEMKAKKGRDSLSVLLSIVLSLGMAQGKRALFYMFGRRIRLVLEAAIVMTKKEYGGCAIVLVEVAEILWKELRLYP